MVIIPFFQLSTAEGLASTSESRIKELEEQLAALDNAKDWSEVIPLEFHHQTDDSAWRGSCVGIPYCGPICSIRNTYMQIETVP